MANAGAVRQGMLHSAKKVTGPIKKRPQKEGKTSRAERGYIEERGPKTKDDWKQFFNSDNNKKKKSKK